MNNQPPTTIDEMIEMRHQLVTDLYVTAKKDGIVLNFDFIKREYGRHLKSLAQELRRRSEVGEMKEKEYGGKAIVIDEEDVYWSAGYNAAIKAQAKLWNDLGVKL